MKKLIFLLILVNSIAYGNPLESEETIHIAAHVGASYAITHATNVACKRFTTFNETTCLISASLISLSAGVLKESLDHESQARHIKGLEEDLTGIGLAVIMIKVDF